MWQRFPKLDEPGTCLIPTGAISSSRPSPAGHQDDTPEVGTVCRWLDTWSGTGAVLVGMIRQAYRVSLGYVAKDEWRAVFSSHPLTSPDGFAIDRVSWRAVHWAAWGLTGRGGVEAGVVTGARGGRRLLTTVVERSASSRGDCGEADDSFWRPDMRSRWRLTMSADLADSLGRSSRWGREHVAMLSWTNPFRA